MKTTVEIDDDLLRAAKRAAIDEGVTLRQVIEDALRARLEPSALGPYGGFQSRGDLYDTWEDFLADLETAAREGARARAATHRAS
jgi:hypothetical protein